MPAQRRSSFPLTRGQRRRTGWEIGPEASAAVVVSAAGKSAWPGGTASALDGMTLVRIRGQFLIYVVTADVVNAGFPYAVGMCMVTEDAFAVGVTAIPDPFTDNGWDGWIWYHSGFIFAGSATEDEFVGRAGSSLERVVVDSKAMRKWPEENVLVGIVGFGTEVGSAIVRFHAETRVLVKLP